jgi:hypothetical protein
LFTQTDEQGYHTQTLTGQALTKKREGWYSETDDYGARLNPLGPDRMVWTGSQGAGSGEHVKASTLNPYRKELWEEGTKTELQIIPGWTTAGKNTAEGYRPGEEFGGPLPPPVPTNPTGAGGSTAASVSAPPPPPKPTSAEARRPPKKPPKKKPLTATSTGSTGAGGATIQADVTGGALATTKKSLIG